LVFSELERISKQSGSFFIRQKPQVVKAVLTQLLVLFLCTGVFAQKQKGHVKMEHHQMDIILDARLTNPVSDWKSKKIKTQKIVRLYRFKNARIKAELSFEIKRKTITV
jgi:hypothetical protein